MQYAFRSASIMPLQLLVLIFLCFGSEGQGAGQRNSQTYVHISGAPALAKVPVIVGFHTARLLSYSSSTSSKVSIVASAGLNFSSFQLSDVQDVVGWPEIAWVETSTARLDFFLVEEALKADSSYEISFLALTSAAGTRMGSITVSWYGRSSSSAPWVEQERSLENQGRGTFPRQGDHLVGATVRTAAGSLTDSRLAAAWAASAGITSYLLDLRMTTVASGIISIMPFPPSAWNFNSLGAGVVDGDACPSGDVGGLEGQAFGVRSPTVAAHCYVRKRGQYVDSVDLWFLAADISKGASLKMFLPHPLAGVLGSWYVTYREFGPTPGYLITSLPVIAAVQQFQRPKPYGALISASSSYPGRHAVLQIQFRPGMHFIYMANSRVELRFSSSVFNVENNGCQFSSTNVRPFGALVLTTASLNLCTMTWSPTRVRGVGTVKVYPNGTVVGSGVDFHTLGVIGMADPESSETSPWHYLSMNGYRYIVKTRQRASASSERVSILAASSGNLIGVGTKFKSGALLESLAQGDQVIVAGRTFAVVSVRSDTLCDVLENGIAPTAALAAKAFRVKWKTRLIVLSFHESPTVPAPVGSSFTFERLNIGMAFWSRTYSMSVFGSNSAVSASGSHEVRVYSGRDRIKSGTLDYWSASFTGQHQVQYPHMLEGAALHPTTIASSAKARVTLAFTTGTSSRFRGGPDENLSAGMLLKISSNLTTALKLHEADGTDLTNPTTEEAHLDCSRFFLELWSADQDGFPNPSHCWWDAWDGTDPGIYMRLQPGNGFKIRTRYEVVFMSTLVMAANSISTLVTLNIQDGDGFTDINYGYGGLTKKMIRHCKEGRVNEPFITSVQVINGGTLKGDTGLQVIFKGGEMPVNWLLKFQKLRLFFYPLTAWHIPTGTCIVKRSDCEPVAVGTVNDNCDTSCDTEPGDRNTNTIILGLSQNAKHLSNTSDTIFTFTGVPAPISGFFRGEIAAEAWYHPFEAATGAASYTTSALGRLGSDNFMSAPVAPGSGYIAKYESVDPYESNTISILYTPAATCRSSSSVPCRLVVTVPDGFTVVSAGMLNSSFSSFMRIGTLNLKAAPTCNVRARTCTFEIKDSFALWAHTRYGMSISLVNPSLPMAKSSSLNVWTVQLSGSYRWGFGRREYAQVSTLLSGGHFAVLGQLRAAAVLPGSLTCGASTNFQFQFITSQFVPAGGMVQIDAPSGFSFKGSASMCEVQVSENLPSGTTCSTAGARVVLTLSSGVEANTFCAFDIRGTWALSIAEESDVHFSIATASNTTMLDVVKRVTWSPQAQMNGALVFPHLFHCYPVGVDLLTITLDDMRPYAVTLKPVIVNVLFRWDTLDIADAPVDLRIYAPPSYQWELDSDNGFNNSLSSTVAAPLMLFPGRPVAMSRADSNVLHLMTTESLKRKTLYGFSAKIRTPFATPGTSENVAGGNAWYAIFGAGMSGQTRWAAARADFAQLEVRAIHSFKVQTGTDVPLWTGFVTAVFTLVTALSAGGVWQLLLPEGFSFAMHAGQACATDGLIARMSQPSANVFPADMQFACVSLSPVSGATKVAALQGAVGSSGLPSGRYAVSVFVKNPLAAEDEGRSPGNFEVRTFLDSQLVVADMPATFPAPIPTQRLPQAELVSKYLDSSVSLFDAHPSRSTWVVFAFELRRAVSPGFTVNLRGPSGFRFQSACQVHVGNGVAYSPLGNSLTIQPAHAPQYALFPKQTNATCTAGLDQREANIQVSPYGAGVGWSSFPARTGKLYLFRVQVTNPAATPEINDWHMKVDDQESHDIRGYNLWEFLTPRVTPSNTATGEHNKVTINFRNMQSIPGLKRGTDHGLVMVQMPSGFQLQTKTVFSSCLDFQGLFNVTIAGRVLMPGVLCQGISGQPHLIYLRNKGEVPLTPGVYEFVCRIRNSVYPLEMRTWRFISYKLDIISETTRLDSSTVPGFALNINLRSFSVQPRPVGQQSSNKNATMLFRVELTHKIASGDLFILQGPPEYTLEASPGTGKCRKFYSAILPPPQCVANKARFSFIGFESDLLPLIQPFGTENSTVVNFELQVTNPPVKPPDNTLIFVHCRTTGAKSSVSGLCPAGWQAVASERAELWSIVPELRDVRIVLLPPQVLAQGKPSLFKLQFRAASGGASKLRIECDGMNFTGCTAEYQSVAATCIGQLGQALVTLAGGQAITNDNAIFELIVRRVVNPVTLGTTTWAITTYNAQGAAVDQTVGHKGYGVSGYLALQPVVICRAEMILDPNIPQVQKSACTASDPWYEYSGNKVTLRFNPLPVNQDMRLGGRNGLGYYLMVQAPAGYMVSRAGVPFEGLSGFPQVSGNPYKIFHASTWNATTILDSYFSSDILGIKLPLGLPQQVPFAVRVKMDNPPQDATRNLWKIMLWDVGAQRPLYTNDGDWPGFGLKGTFQNPGVFTKVQWLVSDFPSEPNVVRLRIRLASPLVGQSLTMRVVAPEGFVFDAVCLPSNPDVAPQLTLRRTIPWVTKCVAQRSRRQEGTLTLPGELAKGVEYAANLLLTNAPLYTNGTSWSIYTFRNNDALNFVHFTKVPAFTIQVMQASVYPEVKKFEQSGFLHVSFRPMRDLGPFGQVLLTAPEAFTVFCRLRPFFDRGNLPVGVTCNGANTFAAVTLSGADALESGAAYHFAVRVTNPTTTSFSRYHGLLPTSQSSSLKWRVRLQTRDRELVHESTQVLGYVPTPKAITRFSIFPSTIRAGAQMQLRVQFKLETTLLRWRTNFLELWAPGGFSFACADELATETYVTPAGAILPGNVARFQNLNSFVEVPPTRGVEIYRNEGTTEDGRAIVDCSKAGRLGLAVDFTEETSLGRFALKVLVRNSMDNPVPNIWTLRSNSDGQLIEEGATGGFEVSNRTLPEQLTGVRNPVSSLGKRLVRMHWLTSLLLTFLTVAAQCT